MQKRIALIVLFTLIVAGSADAQQFIVRTVYFQPTDAPGPTRQIITLLTESQDFYRDEMEHHGYGAKTFHLETDGAGNVGFHHIRGKHSANHYLIDTYNRVKSELPFKFTHDPNAQDNVHVVIIGGLNRLDNGNLGYAWYTAGHRTGGVAVLAGKALHFRLIAHEMGHTFGLYHANDPKALMWSGKDILLDYETRWLDRHHLFNDTHIRNNIPTFIESEPIEAIEGNKVQFKVIAESQSGLYHAQMYRKRTTLVIGSAEIEGKETTIEVDVRREYLTDGDRVSIQIMDIHGNTIIKHLGSITLPEPLPEVIDPPDIVVEAVEKIEDLIDCPDCQQPNETDLSVHPHLLLTTQWAILKQR